MMYWTERYRTAGVIALLVALAAAAPASGATFVDMEIPELVAESDAVIEGRVVEIRSFWDDKGVVIVSEAVIQVDDKIVGKSEDWVTVRTVGGEVGGYNVQAPGFPTLDQDERVVLFLSRPAAEGDAYGITGHPLGKYRVVEDAGEQIARPSVDDGAVLVSPRGGPVSVPRALTLDRLKEDIRDAARLVGQDR
jgi:hypothetical protein